ncbi:MAG: hypothetical protein LUD39_01395, partial [Opitutae bacterium]|nr:hypothetical protein [Opitutae bacterium]
MIFIKKSKFAHHKPSKNKIALREKTPALSFAPMNDEPAPQQSTATEKPAEKPATENPLPPATTKPDPASTNLATNATTNPSPTTNPATNATTNPKPATHPHNKPDPEPHSPTANININPYSK